MVEKEKNGFCSATDEQWCGHDAVISCWAPCMHCLVPGSFAGNDDGAANYSIPSNPMLRYTNHKTPFGCAVAYVTTARSSCRPRSRNVQQQQNNRTNLINWPP